MKKTEFWKSKKLNLTFDKILPFNYVSVENVQNVWVHLCTYICIVICSHVKMFCNEWNEKAKAKSQINANPNGNKICASGEKQSV